MITTVELPKEVPNDCYRFQLDEHSQTYDPWTGKSYTHLVIDGERFNNFQTRHVNIGMVGDKLCVDVKEYAARDKSLIL